MNPDIFFADFTVSRIELFVEADYIPWAGYLGTQLDGVYYTNLALSINAPNELDSKIHVYPNPTDYVLNIEVSPDLDLEYISISDVLGRTMDVDTNDTQIDTLVQLTNLQV